MSAWWRRAGGPAALVMLTACATGPRPPTPPRDPAPVPVIDPGAPDASGPPPAPPPALDAVLTAKRLMVPVDGVAPKRIPDWFDAPRGERVHGALDILWDPLESTCRHASLSIL